MSRVTAPRARRCRSHQHEERRGLVGACRVDPGPGGCPDSVPRRDWRGSWGAFCFRERGWARHCSDAMTTGQVGKVTARRRSAKVRLGKTGVCAPNAHGGTRSLRRSGFKTSASPHRHSACTVCWCRGDSHVCMPKWELNPRNSKGKNSAN